MCQTHPAVVLIQSPVTVEIKVLLHAVIAGKKPIVSSVSQYSVPRVPVPWGKLTKAIVLDGFNGPAFTQLH